MTWHRRLADDEASAWLRQLVRRVAGEIYAANEGAPPPTELGTVDEPVPLGFLPR
jgi:hypothetical protein